MRILAACLTALVLTTGSGIGQIGLTHASLDSLVARADLVVRGKIAQVERKGESETYVWLQVTLVVEDTLKGEAPERLRFARQVVKGDGRWERFIESGQQQLWFLMDSGRPVLGEAAEAAAVHAKYAFKPIGSRARIRLGPAVEGEFPSAREPQPMFTMEFDLLKTTEEIIAATRRIVAEEPAGRPALYSFMIPRSLAQRTGSSGDANAFIVPGDKRLERLAHLLIDAPEEMLPKARDRPAATDQERALEASWLQFSADRLREEGARALAGFMSEENIGRLKALLDHPAKVGIHGLEEREYFVRKAAYEVLEGWGVEVDKPVVVDGRDARPPKDDADLRYWLENMLWHHRYDHSEVAAAIGLEGTEAIEREQERFKIYRNNKPERAAGAPLLVLPYPGGRHPRIGFRDGAVMPQRETKISVFTPWDDESYVVVDVPEAIWSNLGLTYLAHTHVPTIWSERGITLEKLEWNRRGDGTLDMRRELPNGIEFGTKVVPGRDAVRMEMWLKNGTAQKLAGLRVQNCVMLRGARGFAAQSNDNKVFKKPYAAVRDGGGKRWIITAWEPCHRPWGNDRCPCLHSDPKFPDCAPGETQRLRGWLSFYEGEDVGAEFERIAKTGWLRGE